jgi:acetyl-CoA acetyltransferase
MSDAAERALADAQMQRADIDGLLCGYSTTHPHLMLGTLFAEHFGLRPRYAHTMQLGGATGCALVMLACQLVASGAARRILVVGGENRMTGQSRDSAIQTLAQVGHPDYEVPLGATIPAYYGLLASHHMHRHGTTEADFAELAVLMRRHAGAHEGAQFRNPITVDEVLASRAIASPLKVLDCCPVSDGGCAVLVSAQREGPHPLRISGTAQQHNAQHLSAFASLDDFGAGACTARALAQAGSHAGRRGVRRHLRQLHDHADDPAGRDRPGAAWARRRAGARRPLLARRSDAAEPAWRPAQLRPLWRRRCDGPPGRSAPADDRPRGRAPGAEGRCGADAW